MGICIAIDGPAGAGKSTAARLLAEKLGFIYMDTGAMYRAIGVHADDAGIPMDDPQMIARACEDVDITLSYEGGVQHLFLNGNDLTDRLRTEEAGRLASAVSKIGEVRARLVDLQRKLAGTENVVMDGRDIGTVVMPNADLKVFLTASVPVRARRRFLELQQKGVQCDFDDVIRDIEERDYNDTHRAASPLVMAPDAMLIDSSDMTFDEVVACIIQALKEKTGAL